MAVAPAPASTASTAAPRTAPGQTDRQRLAIIGAAPWPAGVTQLLGGTAWCTASVIAADNLAALPAIEKIDAYIVCDDSAAARLSRTAESAAVGAATPAMVCLTDASLDPRTLPHSAITLDRAASTEQIRGAVRTLVQIRPTLRRIETELTSLYALGSQLHTHFDELQRDMTLAARLQRDFLPREMPKAGNLQCATLYRPCNWISGDILDVFQIDKHHVGFHVMDAMGHGVSAALLTMFLRNAIRPHPSVARKGWMQPAEIIAHLNDVLINEKLSDCQFVTGWYGVLNTQTRVLTYCNGGHPPALRISPTGKIESLNGEGCLLGVFAGRTFAQQTVQLEPGDRVLVFSDGLEPMLLEDSADADHPILKPAIPPLLTGNAREFAAAFATHLDGFPGAFSNRADDVSLVVVDVT